MIERYRGDYATIYEGDCREVAATIEPGTVPLSIVDPPYAMGKADWDKMKLDDLPEWLRPHLEDIGRISAPSASLYVWNTAAGWARLDPLIRAMGWTFRVLIVWDKATSAADIGWRQISAWSEHSEVCGFYTRNNPTFHAREGESGNVWRCSTKALSLEKLSSGMRPARIQQRADVRATLHPCQKPLVFADRMIRASSRPGDTVWAPFGGTLREAVAAERMGRRDPAEGRKVVTAELNQDGPDYIGAVLPSLRLEHVEPKGPQAGLFAAVP